MSSEILSTEFSEQFVQGMRDRMVVSYCKYGAAKNAFPSKVNALETLLMRLEQYQSTGNTEFLMDVANYAMIEFMYPAHPKSYFQPTDSKESPGRFTLDEGKTDKSNDTLTEDGWKEIQALQKELR